MVLWAGLNVPDGLMPPSLSSVCRSLWISGPRWDLLHSPVGLSHGSQAVQPHSLPESCTPSLARSLNQTPPTLERKLPQTDLLFSPRGGWCSTGSQQLSHAVQPAKAGSTKNHKRYALSASTLCIQTCLSPSLGLPTQ